jgi:hypothetical protein
MQGKSCFSFTRIDADLFDQFDGLLRRGPQLWRDPRLITPA